MGTRKGVPHLIEPKTNSNQALSYSSWRVRSRVNCYFNSGMFKPKSSYLTILTNFNKGKVKYRAKLCFLTISGLIMAILSITESMDHQSPRNMAPRPCSSDQLLHKVYTLFIQDTWSMTQIILKYHAPPSLWKTHKCLGECKIEVKTLQFTL